MRKHTYKLISTNKADSDSEKQFHVRVCPQIKILCKTSTEAENGYACNFLFFIFVILRSHVSSCRNNKAHFLAIKLIFLVISR